VARIHPPPNTPMQKTIVSGGADPARPDRPLLERISRVIELIRPAVQADGGDVELVGVSSENIALIRLHGACVGCPSSNLTLQMGIERNLREHVPEIRGVRAVD
jgi:Fe-S cluster biogenesis protein NfuA